MDMLSSKTIKPLLWAALWICGFSLISGCASSTLSPTMPEGITASATEPSPQPVISVTRMIHSETPSPKPTGETDQAGLSATATPILNAGATSTRENSADPLPSSTTTPDTRLLPEDWQAWDYLPTVSARAIEIYSQGLANGADPHHFSVVGDCQAISFVFLGNYDRKEYKLPAGLGYLQETIDYFAGSFNRDGMAVRGGFTAASILSPLQSDPKHCKPGETPLACEFRLHNPSILIISLETWSKPDTIDRYETYLRQIVDTAIAHGVLPILLNKADVAEVGGGKHVINPAIARVAYDYDLPWVNFWRSAQFLPNFGIDPDRDGFHLSEEAYLLKSRMALQALDIVSRAVQTDSPGVAAATPTASAVFTATVQATPTIIPSPTITPSPTALPICMAGTGENVNCIAFGYAASEDGILENRGVFLFDLNLQKMVQIAPDGYDIQAVSPDRQQILLNHDSELSIASYSGAMHTKLTDDYFNLSSQGAIWLKNPDKIAWISQMVEEKIVKLYDTESGASIVISEPGDHPATLYPSGSTASIFWGEGTCTGYDFCEVAEVRETNLNDMSYQTHAYFLNPTFSQDGVHVAMLDPTFTSQPGYLYNDRLVVENLSMSVASRRLAMFPPVRGFMVSARLIGYSWSADGSRVFVLLDDYSDYFEKSLVLRGYVFDLETGMLLDYVKIYGAYGSLKPQAVWSPDDSQVLLALTGLLANGDYEVNLFLLDIKTKEVDDLSGFVNLINSEYAYLTHVFWISPQP